MASIHNIQDVPSYDKLIEFMGLQGEDQREKYHFDFNFDFEYITKAVWANKISMVSDNTQPIRRENIDAKLEHNT